MMQKQRPLPAPLNERPGHHQHGVKIICTGAIDIIPRDLTVDHKYRRFLRRLPHIVRVMFVSAAARINGTHQHQRINFLGQEPVHIAFPLLLLIAAAAQDTAVAITMETVLQEIDRPGHISIGNVRADDTHGLHGAEPQPPRKHIGRIVVGLHHRQHLFLGFFTHPRAAVHHSGNCGDGDTRKLRNVVYVNVFVLTFSG